MKQKIIIKAIVRQAQTVLLEAQKTDSLRYTLPGGELPFGLDPEVFINESLRQLGQNPFAVQLFSVTSEVEDQLQSVIITYLANFNTEIELKSSTRYAWKSISDPRQFDVDTTTAKLLNLRVGEVESSSYKGQTDQSNEKITSISQKELLIRTDGGSRGNPGPSAAAYVISTPTEELIYESGLYLGVTTNNQAEYQAVKLALEKALTLNARVVHFQMDSLLIVNQMLGIYQIKNRDLWPIYASIKDLMKKFDTVSFHHVKREFNKEADALVNKTLDAHR